MTTMSTLTAGTSFGPYEIEGFIAGGGMGRVYAAVHTVYGHAVALKVLHNRFAQDPRWQQRFSEEGLVGTRLKHPHVLSARELVNHDDQVALVMDLVSGGQTLLKVIDREFPSGLELSDALSVFLQIVSGVEYLHDRGVVHGDLKPENVLVSGNLRNPKSWRPQVTDFGTVALIADPVHIDGKSAIVASPRYASPEHMLGIDRVSVRSDVHSLGLVLHYLLSGQHASTARSVAEAKAQLTTEFPMIHLVDQPEGVLQVVTQATRRDPAARFADCRALALAIRDRLDELGLGLKLEDLKSELATELIEEQADAQRQLQQSDEADQGDTELDLGAGEDSPTLRSETDLESWHDEVTRDILERENEDEGVVETRPNARSPEPPEEKEEDVPTVESKAPFAQLFDEDTQEIPGPEDEAAESLAASSGILVPRLEAPPTEATEPAESEEDAGDVPTVSAGARVVVREPDEAPATEDAPRSDPAEQPTAARGGMGFWAVMIGLGVGLGLLTALAAWLVGLI